MTKLALYPRTDDETFSLPDVLHPKPFQCSIEILPEQTSAEVDHVNNIEYIRWIDKASQLHCDAQDWNRERLLQLGVMWFVARHEIDYRSEAVRQDNLLLSTWVDDIRRVKSWRSTTIHALDSDPSVAPRLVCACKTLWVLVNLQTRKPTTIPSHMADSLSPLQTPRVQKT